jgi:hypothetical protein
MLFATLSYHIHLTPHSSICFIPLSPTFSYGFLLFVTVGVGFMFFCTPAINMGFMLSVPVENQSFALAMMVVFMHSMGDVPSPIIVGLLKDKLAPGCIGACYCVLFLSARTVPLYTHAVTHILNHTHTHQPPAGDDDGEESVATSDACRDDGTNASHIKIFKILHLLV